MGGLNDDRLFSHLFMVGVVGTAIFGIVAFWVCAAYTLEEWDTSLAAVSLFTFVLSAWVIGLVALFQGYWLPFIVVYLLLGPSLLMTWLFMDYEEAGQ